MANGGSAWRRAASSTLLWGTLVAVGVFVLAIVQDQRVRQRGAVEPEHTARHAAPVLSTAAVQGRGVFEARCASCHGRGARGSRQGPPLVHEVYGASQFADEAIVQAVRAGVAAKRWQFGNMPKIGGVSDIELTALVRYIRELQIAHGID